MNVCRASCLPALCVLYTMTAASCNVNVILLCPGEEGEGGFEDGVAAGIAVGLGHVNLHVGRYAKLGELALCIGNHCCRETYRPAIGQLAGERQAASATRHIAHHGHLR